MELIIKQRKKVSQTVIYKLFRDISAAGIILTSIVPEASNKAIVLPMILGWLFFSFLCDTRGFLKTFIKPDVKSYSVYLWLLTCFLFYVIGYMKGDNVEAYLFSYARFGFSLLIFNYYMIINDYKAVSRLTFFSLCCIIFTCITTLRGLYLHPNAARLLSTGREELIEGLKGMMIGSYGFIYGLVFVSIAILGSLKSGPSLRIMHQIIFATLLGLFVFTIYKATFMTALLIFSIVVIFLLLNVKNIPNLIVVTTFLLTLFFILTPTIYNILISLGNIIENKDLSLRFYEVAYFLKYKSAENTVDLASRLDFNTISLKSFLSSPIIGIGGYYGYGTTALGIGGHSAFLDELARYGIVGAGPLFIALIANAAFVYKRLEDQKQKAVYYCSMLAFFVLGMVNTLLFVPIAVMVYFVVPGVIFTLSEYCPTLNAVKMKRRKLNASPLVR
ncbi:MAG: hypothetical protein ACPL4K_01665 [Candidatus Margulisiibacteriota bacterium]